MRKREAESRPGMFRSLRLRLTLILFATFFGGLLAALLFFYWEALGTQSGLRERSLQEQAREILATVQIDKGGVPRLRGDQALSETYARLASGYGYTFFDQRGTVKAVSVSRTGVGPLPLHQIPPLGEQFGPVYFAGPNRTAAMTVRSSNGSFFLVVSRDDPDQTTLAGSLIEQDATPFLILIPFILAALALIVIVINATLRPLQRASSEASKIGPASTISRVTSRGLPSELDPLVTAFNGALDRLSMAYQFEKRLTADAAHELRTPLAVLRMRLESSRSNDNASLDWLDVQRDFAQIDRLVAQVLDLARKEQSHADIHRAQVNLARTAREAAAQTLLLVERAERSIDVIAPEAVMIASGAADDLRDMLRNLIENSLSHGKGVITVTVEYATGNQQRFAAITVTDEGEGVPEPLRTTVFERFRKGDAATPGAGLGLAIVRHVAESHGGTAAFLTGPMSRIQIRLPTNGSG